MLTSFDLSSITNNISYYPNFDLKDMEKHIMILEEENKQLKNLGYYKAETERLRFELNYNNSLKDKYKNMYNEAAVKLMQLQNSDVVGYGDNEKVVELNQKIEFLVSTNEELKHIADEQLARLKGSREENLGYIENVIPQLEKNICTLKDRRIDLEKQVSGRKKRKLGICEISDSFVNVSARRRMVKMLAPKSTPGKTRHNSKRIREKSVLPQEDSAAHKRHLKGNLYVPSFLRHQRPT